MPGCRRPRNVNALRTADVLLGGGRRGRKATTIGKGQVQANRAVSGQRYQHQLSVAEQVQALRVRNKAVDRTAGAASRSDGGTGSAVPLVASPSAGSRDCPDWRAPARPESRPIRRHAPSARSPARCGRSPAHPAPAGRVPAVPRIALGLHGSSASSCSSICRPNPVPNSRQIPRCSIRMACAGSVADAATAAAQRKSPLALRRPHQTEAQPFRYGVGRRHCRQQRKQQQCAEPPDAPTERPHLMCVHGGYNPGMPA